MPQTEHDMLVLPGELTHRDVGACLAMLRTAVLQRRNAEVVLDATQLERFDSAALAVLLELRRDGLRDGWRLKVLNLSPGLRELARLYGVLELLQPEAAAQPGAPANA